MLVLINHCRYFRMFRVPDHYHDLSLKLSSVLKDIGVNMTTVRRTRRAGLLNETLGSLTVRLRGKNVSCHIFGSQSEGTTTKGLKSDIDILFVRNNTNVIQKWSEWEVDHGNFLMLKDTSIAPGYCMLQILKPDAPLPVLEPFTKYHAIYGRDKVILKNTVMEFTLIRGFVRDGPAAHFTRQGFAENDNIFAFPFKTVPPCLNLWLRRQFQQGRISREIKEYTETSPCYVVPVGRHDSQYQDAEWRISTSHAERCLMMNLNITQIQCYLMLKMVKKSFLKLYECKKSITSFMCKNVLLSCILTTQPEIWRPDNLLTVFMFCLRQLKQCVLREYCPHFIVRENNLMAGKFSHAVKHLLIDKIQAVIDTQGYAFLSVDRDLVGHRLDIKMNNVYDRVEKDMTVFFAGQLTLDMQHIISFFHICICADITAGKTTFYRILSELVGYYQQGNSLLQAACHLVTPLLCSSLGSLIASKDLQQHGTVSAEAFNWLLLGLSSDVASTRLKLASVYYCLGDYEKTNNFLEVIQDKYWTDLVEAVCSCRIVGGASISRQFCLYADNNDTLSGKDIIAFCVKFLPCEVYCVPRELHYEMFKSTQKDLAHRDPDHDFWMDWAVVDALPYMYFLQYKTYGHLQRRYNQQQALSNLGMTIATTDNLGHKDTALNLLGQCMEQESRFEDALCCYMMSLNVQRRNNAAGVHICKLLNYLIHNV